MRVDVLEAGVESSGVAGLVNREGRDDGALFQYLVFIKRYAEQGGEADVMDIRHHLEVDVLKVLAGGVKSLQADVAVARGSLDVGGDAGVVRHLDRVMPFRPGRTGDLGELFDPDHTTGDPAVDVEEGIGGFFDHNRSGLGGQAGS